MGTQKLLLSFGKSTVISHVTDQVLASSVESVNIVVGHHAKELTRGLSGKPVSIIFNTEYQSGMLSSVRAGLRDIPKECQAVLVVLGDQPSITTDTIEQMIKTFALTSKGIVVPIYNGKRGHPILFSRIYCDEILTNFDDVGLRGILQVHPEDILEVPVTSPGVLSDIDYPQDYQCEIEEYKRRGESKTQK